MCWVKKFHRMWQNYPLVNALRHTPCRSLSVVYQNLYRKSPTFAIWVIQPCNRLYSNPKGCNKLQSKKINLVCFNVYWSIFSIYSTEIVHSSPSANLHIEYLTNLLLSLRRRAGIGTANKVRNVCRPPVFECFSQFPHGLLNQLRVLHDVTLNLPSNPGTSLSSVFESRELKLTSNNFSQCHRKRKPLYQQQALVLTLEMWRQFSFELAMLVSSSKVIMTSWVSKIYPAGTLKYIFTLAITRLCSLFSIA